MGMRRGEKGRGGGKEAAAGEGGREGVEQDTGVGPASSAWEADALPMC